MAPLTLGTLRRCALFRATARLEELTIGGVGGGAGGCFPPTVASLTDGEGPGGGGGGGGIACSGGAGGGAGGGVTEEL